MTIQRRFEHHDEVLELHALLTKTWQEVDPESAPSKNMAPYSETFLDMARAVTQAGYHKVPGPIDPDTDQV